MVLSWHRSPDVDKMLGRNLGSWQRMSDGKGPEALLSPGTPISQLLQPRFRGLVSMHFCNADIVLLTGQLILGLPLFFSPSLPPLTCLVPERGVGWNMLRLAILH